MTNPGYWMNETSGVLRPVIEAYLNGRSMTPEQFHIMRVYLRQWMENGPWQGVEGLTARIDGLTDRKALSRWLNDALDVGIDPL